MKKTRAKWGSKTRHGKPLVPSDGTLRPYINGDRPRLPKENSNAIREALNGRDKLQSARAVFATLIAEGKDTSWTPYIREKVKNILF